jgi:hypothetical protein
MKFIIAARPYNHQSFGVVTLHKLYESLRKLNFEVEIIFFEGDGKDCKWGFSRNPAFYRPGLKINSEVDYRSYLDAVRSNGIIIYPEIIYGNPLLGKNVVRYLLNKEKALKPWGMNSLATDFYLTHSKMYREKFDFLLFNPPDIDWVNEIKINDFEKRSIDISYLGKGVKYGFEKIIQGTFEITREWPKSQSQLRLLLNNTRHFFCFDSISSTQLDAILCGSVPFIFEGGPINFEHIKNNAEIPFYTGLAEIDKSMEIKNISFDLVEFKATREKIISTITNILESYEDQVFSLVKKIKSHFSL